jgi:hypothetical protein
MNAFDRWDDRMEREHPVAYVVLCVALLLCLGALLVMAAAL